jgi:hypothetical protein
LIFLDDVGLGKTIEAIAYILCLREAEDEVPCFKPFLVMSRSPANWLKALEKWAPDLHVIDYTGIKEAREVIRDYEFWPAHQKELREKNKQQIPNFDILVTSYGTAAQDSSILKQIQWEVCFTFLLDLRSQTFILDEVEGMSSHESATCQKYMGCKVAHKVLLGRSIESLSPRNLLVYVARIEASYSGG